MMRGKCVSVTFLLLLIFSRTSISNAEGGEVTVLRSVTYSQDQSDDCILYPRIPLVQEKNVVRLSPMSFGSGVIDTLSWRTLPDSWAILGFSSLGDSVAIWFVPSAACTLEAIRVYFEGGLSGPGNIMLDVCGSRYDGHITTTDSTDANGWIGSFEGGQWEPGWVLGHSPLGEHIWGPFPVTVYGSMLHSWVEISTAHLGKPQLHGEPFFVTMIFYPFDRSMGIKMETQNTVPYHLFKYYVNCCGPDGFHNGWFLRSFSIWVEAIVRYYENTAPEISHMDILNYTYAPGPFSIEARVEDRDAEDPGRAGIASVYLHWNINGVRDSTAMSGPSEGNMFSGEIPSLAVGDTVQYFISATDEAGATSNTSSQTFARLKPTNPHADILLVCYGEWLERESEFYRELLDSLEYAYEYWDVEERQGIDESVSLYGWRTVIVFGYDYSVPIPYGVVPIPTRECGDNMWAEFLNTGISEVPANLFYADSWYWNLNQEYDELTFQPGDFACDYFGCGAADDCDGQRCTERVFTGVTGDPVSGAFAAVPLRQTWPLLFAQEYWMTHTAAAETGVDIFTTELGQESGLRVDGETYKTVFLPWDLYQLLEDTGTDTVPSSDVRVLMSQVLQWFDTEKELVRGDINGDGLINVLDVLLGVHIILGLHDPTPKEYVRADCDGNRQVDVTDLIGFVNVILGIGSCPP
jgi:hypothetical protein